MTQIMEQVHAYVPGSSGSDVLHKLKKIAFGADQLTVERARSCQLIRSNSDTETEALQGLVPFASDWHAEVHLLQVCSSNVALIAS